MLLGEVQLHLLPSIQLDSLATRAVPARLDWPYETLAAEAFESCHRVDPTFVPALGHLAEIALRRGDLSAAERWMADYRSAGPDRKGVRRLALMADCVRRGADRTDWSGATASGDDVVGAGILLAPSADSRARTCAQAAFRQVLAAEPVGSGNQWGALVGLQSMLLAEGRTSELVDLLDGAVAQGTGQALGLYVLDATLEADLGPRAGEFIDQLGRDYRNRSTPTLWLIGSWAAATARVEQLSEVARVLDERAATSGGRLDRLVGAAVDAHLSIARSDTGAAIAALRALAPSAPAAEITWSLWEPLAGERLALARLLLSRGDYSSAHRVATGFDHPQPVVFRAYEAASLSVRLQAARALGDERLAEAHRRRLNALGRADLIPPAH
jgi:hypothetical protein